MLKHVQISPLRSRSDSLSLRSSVSCSSSLCGSPEPPNEHLRSHSRTSSFSSLNETIPQTTIKIHTACLRQDIEYKTLGISYETTSKNVVQQVLRRCKMRHRDPRLFYLTMEVTVRRPGVKTILELDDEARPALLQACHPKGDSRFCLQLKPGGLIRVHTSAMQSNSQYKCLVISEETTSDELLSLLLQCCSSIEAVEQFSLYEVCPGQEYQRKLHPDDLPLRTHIQRQQKGELCHFLVRRNPNYPRRRQLLPPITEAKHILVSRLSEELESIQMPNEVAENVNCSQCDENKETTESNENCQKCKNNFKSCEFCNKKNTSNTSNSTSTSTIITAPPMVLANKPSSRLSLSLSAPSTPAYNPVYNIREIRTVCHSFSSLGVDKKLMDIERYNNNNNSAITNRNSLIVKEAVNNDPAKGLGNFVYI